MEKQKNSILRVKMFGGFSMTYNKTTIIDRQHGKSQFSLLLQVLLHNRAGGADKNLIVQTLFEDRDVEDISHSIRNLIYATKKKLLSLGLPDVPYITQKNNIYYWTDQIEVEEDSEIFEQAVNDAFQIEDKKERLAALIAAEHLYTGKFLPNMDRVIWIAAEAKRIREVFHECVNEACRLSTELQQYKDLYDISVYAGNADPFSEWEVYSIKALVALNKFDEAENFYNKAVDSYILEFGSSSTEYVREVIKDMSMYVAYQHENIDQIKTKLKDQEEPERGGYYCTFPVFQELYRTVERVMARSGDHVFLMVCTIIDSKGNPMYEGAKLDELSERLAESIVKSVRHSDTVTKYGKGQYLVLLFDTTEENTKVVQRRINSNFIKGRMRISLSYSVSQVVMKDDGQKPQ